MRRLIIGAILILGILPLSLFSEQNLAAAQRPTCDLTVHIRGGGQVRLVQSSGRSNFLSAAANQAPIPCGEMPRLQAIPDERWQFVRWEHVPAAQANSQVIRADAGMAVTAVFELAGLTYQPLDEPMYDRGGQLIEEIPIVPPALRNLSSEGPNAINSDPPAIDLWYGQNQKFGQIGTPQVWVNIVGNVADPQQDVSSLAYTLNGGSPVSLNIGGDGSMVDKRRLQEVGDFNIELALNELQEGQNDIIVVATDSLNNTDEISLTVDFASGKVWPLPHHVDWNATGNIQDVAQVVDGKWNLVPGGVRTDPNWLGYDRLLDLGDMVWQDFQVQVPVTVHALDPAAYNRISVAPALGFILRWLGHTDLPAGVAGCKPHCGWLYPGAASWYDYDRDGGTDGVFSFWVNHNQRTHDTSGLMLEMNESYYWKARAESPQGTNGLFKMKIWKTSDPEPADWLMEYNGTSDSLQNGSILLLAHHVDVTFGNFSICPVSNNPDTADPIISNVQVLPGVDQATISWTTDEPATSQVDFGLTDAYGTTMTAETECVTDHEVVIEGLSWNQEYHFQLTSEDIEGNSASTSDDTFSTLPDPDVHEIELQSGWNMISTHVQPGDPQLDILFSGIEDQLLLAKNGRGDIYWPDFFIDQIGSWSIEDGYQVYMQQPATLVITGEQIDPAGTPVNLNTGFNLVSYLRDSPMAVDQALNSISSNLVLVKDGSGQLYWPNFSIFDLEEMQPGQGYQIYVSDAAVLTYPAN